MSAISFQLRRFSFSQSHLSRGWLKGSNPVIVIEVTAIGKGATSYTSFQPGMFMIRLNGTFMTLEIYYARHHVTSSFHIVYHLKYAHGCVTGIHVIFLSRFIRVASLAVGPLRVYYMSKIDRYLTTILTKVKPNRQLFIYFSEYTI